MYLYRAESQQQSSKEPNDFMGWLVFASLKYQQRVMLKGFGKKYLNCTEQERLSFRHRLHYSVYEELLVRS